MKQDFLQRWTKVQSQREVERAEKLKSKTSFVSDSLAYRGAGDEDISDEPVKALYAFDHEFKNVKIFVSNQSPNFIEKAVAGYLQGMEIEPLIHQSKYKMNFEIKYSEEKDERKIDAQIKLSKVDEENTAIEFMMI